MTMFRSPHATQEDHPRREAGRHEVLHAMHSEAGLTDDSGEEAFTTLTAKSLCKFYQDNPTATRWVLACLKPPKD